MTEIEQALKNLDKWVSQNGWTSYDPYDGLASPLSKLLPKGFKLPRQVMIQAVKRSPLNLRPLLGIPPAVAPKTVGLLLSAYALSSQVFGGKRYLDEAVRCGEWLVKASCTRYSHYCWGYPFDVETRALSYPHGTPTIVATAFIGHAFLDLYEATGDDRWCEVARQACIFIEEQLCMSLRYGEICLGYAPGNKAVIHNANMLGASLLARTSLYRGKVKLELAERAADFTVTRQHEGGWWPYGEGANLDWCDNFHTAFILDSFWHLRRAGVDNYDQVFQQGLDYYLNHFFAPDGQPFFYADGSGPTDIRCVSEAIRVLAKMNDFNDLCLAKAEQVAGWSIRNMQHQLGFFIKQPGRHSSASIPFMRWSEATMMLALATLLATDKIKAVREARSIGGAC